MSTKTLSFLLGAAVLAAVAYVLNRKAAIPVAPGGAAPEPHTGPGNG